MEWISRLDERVLNKTWWAEGILSEAVIGFLFFGLLVFIGKCLWDCWCTFKIFRIISVHNGPTRTRQCGIHARDRFMTVFESRTPLRSTDSPCTSAWLSGCWSEKYVDTGILEHHGLVSRKLTEKGFVVEALRGERMCRWVYWLCKVAEVREERHTIRFMEDKTGRLRHLPKVDS